MENILQKHILLLGILLFFLTGCIGLTDLDPADPVLVNPNLAPSTATTAIAVQPNPTPGPIPVLDLEEQAAAMLPIERAELENLLHLTSYHLDLDIDYSYQTFTGSGLVHYQNNTGQPLEMLYFHLLPNGGGSYGSGSLDVSSTSVDGISVASVLVEGGRLLQVPLPVPLQESQGAIVQFDFNGEVPENFEGGGYGLYNYSQGVLVLTGWYPLLAVYDDRGWSLNPPSNIGDSVFAESSFYTVNVQADQELVLIATGSQVERESSGKKRLYRFVSGPVREFALVLAPNFLVESEVYEGTRINSYYLPGSAAAAQEALTFAVNSLEVFNSSFGIYPYAELDLVEAPLRYAAGVEFPGIILLHRNAYTQGPAPYLADLVAHEVAHQWWYNVIGNDVFEHPWLDEALATYSSAVYVEFVDGEEAYLQTMTDYQEGYDRLVRSGRDEPVASPLAYFEQGGLADRYGPVVYAKGALFFHVLRQEIGDEVFFEVLQDYYQTMKYDIAFPEDLLGIFEAHHSESLAMLYREWLYSNQ
jgi:hypothetical protein